MATAAGQRSAPLCIVVTVQRPCTEYPMVIRELFVVVLQRGKPLIGRAGENVLDDVRWSLKGN